MVVPAWIAAPFAGDVMVDVGGVVSVVSAAGSNPGCSVTGWTPMSANRFTVACCILRSALTPRPLLESNPNDHCTVPAPNTRAPLGARYRDMWWVAVPAPYKPP